MYLHFIRPLNISQSNVGEVFLYSNFHHYTLPSSPNVGRVAQREKKFNQFYCLIMILGYKRNSKLPKVK